MSDSTEAEQSLSKAWEENRIPIMALAFCFVLSHILAMFIVPAFEEAEVVEADVVEAEAEVVDPGESGVDDIMSKLGELDGDDTKSSDDDKPESSDGDDDLMSKLNELDDPENKPKKKEEKSDDEEDASGMDDLLGKLDEL